MHKTDLMKISFLPLFCFLLIGNFVSAQRLIDPKGMNYVISSKPNNIIFRDTLYSGKKQFEGLFYRTMDPQLIQLLDKHQSNKITGQILGFVGTIATIAGIRRLSGDNADKGAGWALIGGGLATTITGGYFSLMGQRNLQMAVTLFNKKYHQASIGIGVSEKNAGLVYNF